MEGSHTAFHSIRELVDKAREQNIPISEVVLADQQSELQLGHAELLRRMEENLETMIAAVQEGLKPGLRSNSGLTGGDAARYRASCAASSMAGSFFDGLIYRALAVSELNAAMGRIVAAPTAGSCGIIPAVLLTYMQEKGAPKEQVALSLFTCAGVGMVIAQRASLSGAAGGCQAECGSASAMAAAALAELAGGTPEMAASACAVALKNVLGLVCDPVAGLVEVPCIKRNVMGAVNAAAAANLALAGITSVIPADEVIDAMQAVGGQMPADRKETAKGGLAATPTACEIARRLSERPQA